MERIEVECVVIGAGVVGLAIARALAMGGRDVFVLEAAEGIGTGISSRNSEVIHAGLYYPPGGLKASTCVAGRRALYAYCAERGIAHRRTGKLIVATDAAEVTALEGIAARARANGVEDLTWLDAQATRRLEPALRGVGALLSPSTGIIDSHGFMLALQGDAEAAGATVALHTPVTRGAVTKGGVDLVIGGADPAVLAARLAVNAAGLSAPAIARSIEGMPRGAIPTERFCKGSYFTLSGRAPFRHLIYPAPEAAGLGVHLTLDLAGQARFGPDVEWLDAPSYDVERARAERFHAAIRRYWPGLPDNALVPGYAGVRPKISGPGEPAADFRVEDRTTHGIDGLIHLFGIESPGLTAALALGSAVAAMVDAIDR